MQLLSLVDRSFTGDTTFLETLYIKLNREVSNNKTSIHSFSSAYPHQSHGGAGVCCVKLPWSFFFEYIPSVQWCIYSVRRLNSLEIYTIMRDSVLPAFR